jgi:hypothetical protein
MFNNYKVVFPTRPEHSTVLTSGTGRCLLMRFTPISFSQQGQRVTGNKEVRDRNNDPPNLVGVREQAGPLDRQATKRQGPGDIYNVLRSPEGVVDEEELLDCR